MNQTTSRRTFLKRAAVVTAGAVLLPRTIRASSPNETVRVAIIGCNGRGMQHIAAYLGVPNAEIVRICDVDSRAVEKGIAAVAKERARKPKGVSDLRRVFDDPEVDVVSIATPDHWHAPAAILACAAGKNVYFEKPRRHNLRESELIVAAARKHKRVVQMGNQRRSWPWLVEAMETLRGGELGKLAFARGWYTNHRASIGHGKVVPAPEWLDYSLWQGPAPEQPFRDNLIHYNWHWFWNWGTGEMGNNGVHALDIARWGLGVDLPARVTCGGSRYHYPDEWETPDTITATFDFGDKGIVWEGQSCDPRGFEGVSFGITFFGEKGTMVVTNLNATIYDHAGKLVREAAVGNKDLFGYDAIHFGNFIDGIREGKVLKAEIEEGQKSTTLCHLANIAWRTGHTVDFDPKTRRIMGDRKAAALAERKYRRGWEPKV
jgi:predicted dehydrogenase